MSVDFHVIIPARYHSTRLPYKLLMDLSGIPVIERVYQQALKANPHSVCVATDHKDIFDVVKGFGGQVVMTSAEHQTGTDRLAEVISDGAYAPDDIVVNVQGDEPFIPPDLIRQVAGCLHNTTTQMATLCWPVDDAHMLTNPNVVKVVRDVMGHALYFSRSPIPAHRDDTQSFQHLLRHIGIYAYRAAFVVEITKMPVCALETLEALEQLRVLWAGHKIRVDIAHCAPKQDINTIEDLLKARAIGDA